MATAFKFGGPASGFKFAGGGSSGPSGVWGFISNLGTDVKNAAFGIPAGLVNMVEHPEGSIKAMASSTWHDWAPLFHGDFHKEWTQFLAHPLAPILDVTMAASVLAAPFTGGASLDIAGEAGIARMAIKVGDLASEADIVSKGGTTLAKLNDMTRLAKIPAKNKFGLGDTSKYAVVRYHIPAPTLARSAAEGPDALAMPVAIKPLSNNPLIRMRQIPLTKLGASLTQNLPDLWGKAPGRIGLVNAQNMAHFERLLSGRNVTFEGNKELTGGIAAKATAEGATALAGKGVDTQALSDYEVASHAAIASMIHAGEWLGKAPSEQWAGLLQWMHGTLVNHPMLKVSSKADLKQAMKQGMIGVKAEFPGMVAPAGGTFEDALGAASGTGAKGFLTGNAKLMAKDAEGNFLLVPHQSAFGWLQEGKNSAAFVKKLYTVPARVWKLTQVAWSPKTVINTSVGNTFMVLMGQPRAMLHLVDGVRAMKGARAAQDMLRETGTFQPGILREHFGDIIHSSNAAAKSGVSPLSDVLGPKTSKAGKILKTGFYGGVHKVEQSLKAGSVIASLHAAPEVKAIMRDTGRSFQDAAQMALKDNPQLRDATARTALLHIGNYEAFSKREQKLKNVVPFYSWDRHIVLHTVNMLAMQPIRAAALASVGQQGSALTDKMLPGIPTYMRTNLPLAALGIASNKTLDTIGLNPYSSVADIAGSALGLTAGSKLGPDFAPSEDLSGQLSPLITGAIQGLTGHSILTDKAVAAYGGPISTSLVGTFNNLPQVRIARLAAFGAPQSSNPPLYADTFQRLLSKYGGVPIQQPNLARAQATEAKIHKKKKSGFSFG